MVLNNMADFYITKGDLDQALECSENSLALRNEQGSLRSHFTSYDFLIQILIEKGDLKQAQQYFNQLEQMNNQLNDINLNMLYLFDRALLLKASPMAHNRDKAEEIFIQLLENEDMIFEFTVKSLLHLCELLLTKLSSTTNLKVMDQILFYVNQMKITAENSDSYWLLAEAYLLQAKLKLVILDLQKAKESLEEAQKIAMEHDLSQLTERILKEMKEEEELVKAFAALERMNQLNQIASAEIAKIVANLRRFIKLDEAKWQFADLREGIDNVIALMEPEFSGQISFIKEYGDIPSIYCSPSSLNQVFMSLFRNAFEATEGRGEIYLCASMQSKHVKIEVRDTGNGIPAEDIDRIFDPGFTTKGGRVGVGFGLSICYRIVVDEHKGSIDVSSEPGKGTTFTITLPQYYDGGLRDVTEL